MKEEKTEIDVKHETSPSRDITQDWEPIRSLRHQIDRLMSDMDWPDFRVGWPRRSPLSMPPMHDFAKMLPPVDLVERNGGYELQAELPGLTSDQVEVKLADGMMTIKGEKTTEKTEDEQGYYLRERSYGSFQRSFRVPSSVDPEKIEAQFENGVLKVTLPKSENAKQQERKIDINAK